MSEWLQEHNLPSVRLLGFGAMMFLSALNFQA